MTLHRTLLVPFAVVALSLTACTVTFVPDPERVDVVRPAQPPAYSIERFESARSTYWIGDDVSFFIRTRSPGFITLTAFDPDGSSYVIARNAPVSGGRTEVLPALGGRTSFMAGPPTGWHVVRAHFTPERTPERVSFTGLASFDAWRSAIYLEISAYGLAVDDVAEVRFYIRR